MHSISVWKDLKTLIRRESSDKHIKNAALGYIIDEEEVFSFPSISPIGLKEIKLICCNNELVLSLTTAGIILGWGDNKSGLLGDYDHEITNPIQIPNIFNVNTISLSSAHAAAVDARGLLYTWGCPLFGKLGNSSASNLKYPELVISSRAFTSIDVVCGEKYTCVRSDGCFIHIYGELGLTHEKSLRLSESKSPKANRSYSHPELDKYSVVQLVGGSNFISILVDTGEVYILDGCMDLVKLPTRSEDKVLSIVSNFNSVLGLSSEFVLSWQPSNEIFLSGSCSLSGWFANVFKTNEDIKIWAWEDHFLVFSKPQQTFYNTNQNILPYKRSEYGKKIIETALESPNMSLRKESRVPLNNFEDLERLFPGDSSHTIEKIMNCRIEYNKKETLLKAFAGLVHPIAQEAFLKLKEYVWVIKIHRNTISIANLFSIISSFYKRSNLSLKKLSFEAINRYKNQNYACNIDLVTTKYLIKNVARVLNTKQKSLLEYGFTKLSRFPARVQLTHGLEKFLKVLRNIVSNKIKKILEASLNALKVGRNSNKKAETLKKCLRNLIFNTKNSTFSFLFLESSKNYQLAHHLKKILKSQHKSILNQIFLYSRQLIQQKLLYFSILINSIVDKSLFKTKIYCWNILKMKLCLSIEAFDKDTEYFIMSSGNSPKIPINRCQTSNQLVLSSFETEPFEHNRSLSSSMKLKHPSLKALNSPGSVQSRSSHNSVSGKFQEGELLRYKKYLVKKKLEVVRESFNKPSHHKRIKRKSVIMQKPPWRPAASVSNNFDLNKESAIRKGFDYNERIREKLLKQKNPDQLSSSYLTYLTYDDSKLIKKKSNNNGNSGRKSANLSLNISEGILNIGLGNLILNRVYTKTYKRVLSYNLQLLKKFNRSGCKHPAPIPVDCPKTINSADTILMIKSSWQMGVIIIASEKTKKVLKRQASRIFFGALKSMIDDYLE
jgi:Regulator of chromosome condensation (RCC1) repeat